MFLCITGTRRQKARQLYSGLRLPTTQVGGFNEITQQFYNGIGSDYGMFKYKEDDCHVKLLVKKRKTLYGFLALSSDKLNFYNAPHSVVPSPFCFPPNEII